MCNSCCHSDGPKESPIARSLEKPLPVAELLKTIQNIADAHGQNARVEKGFVIGLIETAYRKGSAAHIYIVTDEWVCPRCGSEKVNMQDVKEDPEGNYRPAHCVDCHLNFRYSQPPREVIEARCRCISSSSYRYRIRSRNGSTGEYHMLVGCDECATLAIRGQRELDDRVMTHGEIVEALFEGFRSGRYHALCPKCQSEMGLSPTGLICPKCRYEDRVW